LEGVDIRDGPSHQHDLARIDLIQHPLVALTIRKCLALDFAQLEVAGTRNPLAQVFIAYCAEEQPLLHQANPLSLRIKRVLSSCRLTSSPTGYSCGLSNRLIPACKEPSCVRA